MNSARAFVRSLHARVEHLLHELAKFGVVGAIAFVVDVGTFNLLRNGAMDDKVLTAKVISTVLATTVAFIGNRQWTFKHRERAALHREYVLFFVLNGLGLAISLSFLALSHYVLGFTSPLADNISANIVGMAFATIFRFWSYRRYVFTAPAPVPPAKTATEPLAA
ncbi:MAG TPA: GtrA family protein [Sporichthya sp.]|nr:GtrA family protein [Sporichthya sp.]